MRAEKKQIRQQTLDRMAAYSPGEHARLSAAIEQRFLEVANLQPGMTVALTLSHAPEVDTRRLVETLWARGIATAAPKCEPTARGMEFYAFTSWDELETVYLHLEEPIPARTRHREPADLDLVIVPGVAFAPDGFRIGFGGGYYDRYLLRGQFATVSLAFEAQMRESVPVDLHDIPVDCIVTPERAIDARAHREDRRGLPL